MTDEVQQLLTQLEELSPVPDDELADLQILERYGWIVEQLAEYKDSRCIKPLLDSFGLWEYWHGHDYYWHAMQILERFDIGLLTPYLLTVLGNKDKGPRLWATMMVMRSRNKAAIPALIALLDDDAEDVKDLALRALGKIGGAAIRPYIERLQEDPSAKVRSRVKDILEDWVAEEIDAPYPFLSALSADTPRTRAWGSEMLIRSRNKEALPGLIALLEDEADYTRALAAEVLSTIGGTAMRPRVDKLRDDPSAELRGVARKILDTWDKEAADDSVEVDNLLAQLRAFLPMPDDDLAGHEFLDRYANIVEQLTLHQDSRCIEPLLESFGYTDDGEVYWRIVDLLESFEQDEIFPYLLAALRHENRGTRLWAARMLKRSGNTESVLNLIGLLDDEAEYVRAEAVSALSVLGGVVMQLSIERLRDDPSAIVRTVVNQTLIKWEEEAQ